jgi:hypothetical protein
MLDVARQVGAGHRLHDPGELDVERGGAGAERFEGDTRLLPTFDAAVERLRDPGLARHVDLAQPLREARLPESDPDPATDIRSS